MVNQPIKKSWTGNLFYVVRFDLGPPSKSNEYGQPKSAYNSLSIGRRGLGW